MSYDDKTDRMNWNDEFSWLSISIVSGFLLSLLFLYYERFPKLNIIALFVICCLGFYLISILVRIQNHRGKPLTGKTGIQEKYLKFIFPLLGFGVGSAILLAN